MMVAVSNFIDHQIHFIQDFPTMIKMGFGFTALYISLVFVAFMFYSIFIQILPRHVDFDYVVVLGAGLIDGLRPVSYTHLVQISDRTAAPINTALKLLNNCITDNAGKITSAEINKEPTRFIASTTITAMITAKIKLI